MCNKWCKELWHKVYIWFQIFSGTTNDQTVQKIESGSQVQRLYHLYESTLNSFFFIKHP